ncbi:MAG: DUF1501 domain-containing protein [Pirellulales bacterium]
MSQLESWDPKPATAFEVLPPPFRRRCPGSTSASSFRTAARQLHHLTLIRSVCTKDNSHSAGVARIQRGDPKNRGVTYPYFGSAVARLLGLGDSNLLRTSGSNPEVAVSSIRTRASWDLSMGPSRSATASRLRTCCGRPVSANRKTPSRNALRAAANRRYAARRRPTSVRPPAMSTTRANPYAASGPVRHVSAAPRDVERYGTHELGRHLLQRKMIEAGVTFVKADPYGWDTHGDNFNGHLSLACRFDQPFAALLEDLAERQMLDHVLVIAMSEFGRTPRINGHVGRDHWPEAWSVAMAGAGLKRGIVVGETNAVGTWVQSQEFDIGHLFHTWFHRLGIDTKKQEYDNQGQPLPLAHDDCHVIQEALA